jgi:predicted NAD/FAD-dependent oxidoreductase
LKPLDRSKVTADFAAAVNMDADELGAWLETAESKRVGFKRDGDESVGHASGRRIVQLLRHGAKNDEDFAHMRKVVGFVRRHRAQEPANMVTSRWRYSLMNWGHDPLK